MSLTINIFLLLFGVTGTLAAFGGETWRKTDEPLFNRITKRGWISLSCLLLALTFGIIKEVRNNYSSNRESERRKFLEKQLIQTRDQLASANNRLKELSTMVEKVPRQTYSQYISVPAHGTQLLRIKLYGGDEFKYNIYCQGLYLQTSFDTYYLDPRFNSIIIASIRGVSMSANLINKSNSPCGMKGNVHSIIRLNRTD